VRARISLPIDRRGATHPTAKPIASTHAAPATSDTSERASSRMFPSASPSAMPSMGPNSIAISIAPMMTAAEFSRRPNAAMNVAAAFIAR